MTTTNLATSIEDISRLYRLCERELPRPPHLESKQRGALFAQLSYHEFHPTRGKLTDWQVKRLEAAWADPRLGGVHLQLRGLLFTIAGAVLNMIAIDPEEAAALLETARALTDHHAAEYDWYAGIGPRPSLPLRRRWTTLPDLANTEEPSWDHEDTCSSEPSNRPLAEDSGPFPPPIHISAILEGLTPFEAVLKDQLGLSIGDMAVMGVPDLDRLQEHARLWTIAVPDYYCWEVRNGRA